MLKTIPDDAERLRDLAAWFDYAARWLAREVSDSRVHGDPAEDDTDPDQRVEEVTFITSELDDMVAGFRKATDMLVELSAPTSETMTKASRKPNKTGHLRVINGGLVA